MGKSMCNARGMQKFGEGFKFITIVSLKCTDFRIEKQFNILLKDKNTYTTLDLLFKRNIGDGTPEKKLGMDPRHQQRVIAMKQWR